MKMYRYIQMVMTVGLFFTFQSNLMACHQPTQNEIEPLWCSPRGCAYVYQTPQSVPAKILNPVISVSVERSPSRCAMEASENKTSDELAIIYTKQLDAFTEDVIKTIETRKQSRQNSCFQLDLNKSLINFWSRVQKLPEVQRESCRQKWEEFVARLNKCGRMEKLIVQCGDKSHMPYIAILMATVYANKTEIEAVA